jgi:pyruvate ferredoxin oxidoreductase delta subunit
MQDINLLANDNRGKAVLGGELADWDQVTQGCILPSFEGDATGVAHKKAEERAYSDHNSYTATVASWRVKTSI